MALYGPQLVLARAWVAAASGSTTLAIELAGQSADAAFESGQLAVAADALHDAARFGDRGAAERFDDVAAFVRGALVEPQVRHARGVADGDGSALDAASADFETLGLLLSAADAAAQAASAHQRAGRKRATAESSARAFRLAAVCGGAETPAVRSAAHPLPLTTREREIATLIAAGLSNAEIADRLFLSVRTVEGHIYRACTKLDLTDRRQLGDLIQRPDDSVLSATACRAVSPAAWAPSSRRRSGCDPGGAPTPAGAATGRSSSCCPESTADPPGCRRRR